MRMFLALLVVLASLAQTVMAQVPVPLEPWRAWALKDQQFRNCPLIASGNAADRESFLCAWPGVLELRADADGVDIAQRWQLDAEGWVPLPGDAERWPQQVSVNGRAAVVIDRQGPSLWLAAGQHDVTARIDWQERPQTLRVSESVARITLNVDGRLVAPVQRNGGYVTLGRGAATTVEADSVELRVFRKYTDSIPGELSTQIRIYASGQAREETFGPVLPAGFVPLALDSEDWPARLDDEGMLRVQVQPGTATLTLTARAAEPLESLVARVPAQSWAAQEIWSYESVPRLRVTSVSGTVQIDPNQVDVPDEWAALPAFALDDGSRLVIEERSRGSAEEQSNRLVLRREAWLDFSGDGWFARDHVSGRMHNGWRFDVAAPFALQRAETIAANGEVEPMLVTRGPVDGHTGVEWRTPDVNLRAGVRIDSADAALPIAGWQQVFDQVTTTVHLPHGYRLIAAPGSDRANGSWLSRWTLLDVFIAAIAVLLAVRLFGWAGGVIAALYLVLGFQETGAPRWTLLAVLAFALVARALPPGRLASAASFARMAALALLLFTALPFVAAQLRMSLHPQLEESESSAFDAGLGRIEQEAMPTIAEAPPPPPAPSAGPSLNMDGGNQKEWRHKGSRASESANLETIVVTGSRVRAVDLIQKYSSNTVVQTGAGEPGWRLGNSYTLNWSGPVLPAQHVDLVVASPWLVRSLRVIMVLLLGWLVWRALGARRPRAPDVSASAVAISVLVLSMSMLVAATPAAAQGFPPDDLLAQLRARLTEAPACVPQCATIANAQVTAAGDAITVVLEVHAAERVALPLPADDGSAVLQAVRVDGVVNDALLRANGKPWIAMSRGVHRIDMQFTAVADKVDLAFAMAPRHISFSGDRWQASGVAEQRLLTEALTLVRAREQSDAGPMAGAQQFPTYVRVTRRIRLDLDWNMSTNVYRMAPVEGGITFDAPVIDGERVSTPGLRVRDGRVTVALADGVDRADWDSTLEKKAELRLTAPALGEHAEVWRVLVSPTWHVDFAGVPEAGVDENDDSSDYRDFEFHPLPGESLTMTISKPDAVDGATRAIDKVELGSEFGQRASTHTLRFDVRASQGGQQSIALPATAEVISVMRAGVAMPARALDGGLSIPLQPGSQSIEVRFRDNAGIGLNAATPSVSLGLPSANIDLRVSIPRDRWLLAASGPAVGPAVLLWGEVLVMLVLAWLLSRWPHSPLRLHQWLLLGIGFSTFSWIALAVVVVWLVALDWRARAAVTPNWRFNVGQLGLVMLTVVALSCLVASIHNGLLGEPDMVVSGNDSYGRDLKWFADRSDDALPVASVISLPLWIYNVVMLAWALWLAAAVVGWLRRGFAAWTRGGYWRAWREPGLEPAIDVPSPPPPGPTAA